MLLCLAVAITGLPSVVVQYFSTTGTCQGASQTYSGFSGICQTYTPSLSTLLSCDATSFTFQLFNNRSCIAASIALNVTAPLGSGCYPGSNLTTVSYIASCNVNGGSATLQSWLSALLEWVL